ncbi:MAG: phosphatase PAP2 family protein [Bacteroidales bacterium]|nr:phosphatase PAP2 family protein [Bacteroidales bacterium]
MAFTASEDSVYAPKKRVFSFQKAIKEMDIVPVILFTGAAASWNTRQDVRNIRNDYAPRFRYTYDDWLQYLPGVSVYALRLAGKRGRNGIGRAALSHGTSLAIMGILVNVLKYSIRVERPDRSAQNAFPSGHTAMAFTNAFFLDREYGQEIGYSIAGYGIATATGITRMLNNKHWVSDVLAGAGVGILAGQLGYFFIDRLFDKKGKKEMLSDGTISEMPSFFSIKTGAVIHKGQTGMEYGMEGIRFLLPHWGIGSSFTLASLPVDMGYFDRMLPPDYIRRGKKHEMIQTMTFSLGAYYALMPSPKWHVNLKGAYGYTVGTEEYITNQLISPASNKIKISHCSLRNAHRLTGGISATYLLNTSFGLTAYLDYNYSTPSLSYTVRLPDNPTPELSFQKNREKMNFITSGLRLTLLF